jgi:DNA-binding NarL/FixJ family response regulator
VRVVIADDSVLLREGAVRILQEAGVEVVGQAGDGEDLLRKVRAHRPDVAIIDIRMPPDHLDEGLRAAETLRAELPEIAGTEGVGYLLKDRVADIDRFVDGVRRVAEGGSVLDPEVVSQMLGRRRGRGPLDTLTPRERDVLATMAEGQTNRAIAGAMAVTERAVERHVTAIFEKLGLSAADGGHRRVLAVLAYLRDSP